MKFPSPNDHDSAEIDRPGEDSHAEDREIVSLEIDANSGELVAIRGTADAIRKVCATLVEDHESIPVGSDVPPNPTAELDPSSDDFAARDSDSMAFSRAAEEAIRRRANPMRILSELISRPSQDATPSPFLREHAGRERRMVIRKGGA